MVYSYILDHCDLDQGDKDEEKKDIITKILVSLLCAVIGAASGSIATSHY